jgi:hypothetical protein
MVEHGRITQPIESSAKILLHPRTSTSENFYIMPESFCPRVSIMVRLAIQQLMIFVFRITSKKHCLYCLQIIRIAQDLLEKAQSCNSEIGITAMEMGYFSYPVVALSSCCSCQQCSQFFDETDFKLLPSVVRKKCNLQSSEKCTTHSSTKHNKLYSKGDARAMPESLESAPSCLGCLNASFDFTLSAMYFVPKTEMLGINKMIMLCSVLQQGMELPNSFSRLLAPPLHKPLSLARILNYPAFQKFAV